jgi:hypothetical protein
VAKKKAYPTIIEIRQNQMVTMEYVKIVKKMLMKEISKRYNKTLERNMPTQSAFKALFGKILDIAIQAKLRKTAYFSIQPLAQGLNKKSKSTYFIKFKK